MNINEALTLIGTKSITGNKDVSTWADLGCGDGLFTLALGRMLASGSAIYGIDKNSNLESQVTSNQIKIIPKQLDFVNDALDVQDLDGILMANSLHYVSDQQAFIKRIAKHLKPGAFFLIVEYNTDIPVARWVPYPVSFLSLTNLFQSVGYKNIQKLGERTSIYGRANMYSALIGLNL